MSDVTKDDLRDLRDTLADQMTRGFSGLNSRLDALNGRVGLREVEAGRHDIRLKSLERRIYARRRDDRDDDGDGKVTERDVRVSVFVLGIAGSGLLFFWKILPALIKVVAP